MKNIIDSVLLIIAIIVVILSLIKSNNYNKNKEYTDEYIEQLNDSLNTIKFKYDSVLKHKQIIIDSLYNIKQNTITIYDKAEIDFSDSNIVDDDSIIRYIAKKIQD